MRVHSNAATISRQREAIQSSARTYRCLAAQWGVSLSTVHRWKHRTDTNDRSSQPRSIRYGLTEQEQRAALCLRRFKVSLDDITDALAEISPNVRRSSVYRLLKRHRLNRLPSEVVEHKVFKEYEPGYLHIDSFMLARIDGVKRYCYVAVDRATRLVLLRVYENRSAASAKDFLRQCVGFFPFRLCKVLTDNGKEYGYSHLVSPKGFPITRCHPFELLCMDLGIEHRRTRPYTPKTNGMVERMIGRIEQETVDRFRYPSQEQMLASLRDWLIQYNFYRKNRTIGRLTPYEAACRWLDRNQQLANLTGHMLAVCSQPCET
jgi:transposase InsO family protein